jgi:hypothetical protein
VDVQLPLDPKAGFASQTDKDWCAVAGTQTVLAALGLADDSKRFQSKLAGRIGEWESRRDSHNGGWGPSAIALALAYGASDYEVRAYEYRATRFAGPPSPCPRRGSRSCSSPGAAPTPGS